MTVTLGVDLASQPRGTALCTVRWSETGAAVERMVVGADDDAVLAWSDGADAVGVDAPFGWPQAFAQALARWTEGGPWPGGLGEEERKDLRLRATDRAMAGRGKHPMSVSADKLALCAMRAAVLLTAKAGDGPALSRHEGPWFEVYPGGALYEWELLAAAAGYKRAPEPRARLLKELQERCGGRLAIGEAWRERCIASDHALDALLCALAARAAALGLTYGPGGLDTATLDREGWMHVPRVSLGALTDASARAERAALEGLPIPRER